MLTHLLLIVGQMMKGAWLAMALGYASAVKDHSGRLQNEGTCTSDINSDGLVSVDDLLNLLAEFGRTCVDTPAPDCSAQVDLQVATQFCEQQGGPQETTTAFCLAETSDSDALLAACSVLGVGDTGRFACSDLGYSEADCADVAATVAAAFPDCASLAVGAPGVCPALAALTTETDCQSWAANNAQNLGLGSGSIAALEPHTAEGTNFNDFCVGAGGPQAATNAACVGISGDEVRGACLALGGPIQAVTVLCGQLGFSAATCTDIAATIPAEVNTCDALVAAQPVLCQGIAAANDDPDCDAWAPNGFIGGAPAALNDAVAALSADEFALLAAACASVAANGDAACAGHVHGHICAHVPAEAGR